MNIDVFKMKSNLILLFICMLSCGLFSCSESNDSPNPNEDTYSKIGIGDTLPEFSVTAVDGTVHSNQSLKGTISVVMFFYTPCRDCQYQLPIVDEVYKAYSKDVRIQWIGIGRSESADQVAAYWSENRFTLPYSPQEDNTIYRLFATNRIPRIYVTSPQGIVVAKYDDHSMLDLHAMHELMETTLQAFYID